MVLKETGTYEEVVVIFKGIMITYLTKHRGIGLHIASTYLISLHPYHEWEWRKALHSVQMRNLLLWEVRRLTPNHIPIRTGT